METLLHAGLSNAVSATFLAVLVACLARPLARRPAVLHCLWLLVLLKLVTPPLYRLPVRLPERPAGSWENQAGDALLTLEIAGQGATSVPARIEEGMAGSSLWRRFDLDWLRILAVIWLAGTAASIVVASRRIVRFQRLLDEAQPASEEIQEWVGELTAILGLKRPPSVWWTRAKVSPMLWSLGRRPRLIIPLSLWKSLDDRQRSTLVVHELAHLRRGDHRVRFFELVVTILYWWHPVSWWARRALRDVEEQCCDAWVVWTFPDAARSYAETLLETLDFLNQRDQPEPLLASGFGKVHHLRRRLTMIMSGSTPRLVSIWGALGSLALAALLLPVTPTWAQKPGNGEKQKKVIETVVVGDPEKVGTEAAAIDLDDLIVFTVARDAEPTTEVNVTVKPDDQPAVVVSGSLDQAITALKNQIDAINKNSNASQSDKKRAEALAKAIEEINKVAQKVRAIDAASSKDKSKVENKRIVVRNLDLGKVQVIARPHVVALKRGETAQQHAEPKKAKTDEEQVRANVRYRVITKGNDAEQLRLVKEKQDQIQKAVAEMEKARAKVNELAKELAKKREELSRANSELSRMQREAKAVAVPERLPAGHGRVSSPRPGPASGQLHGFTIETRKADASDNQRLAELEKKLDKILEEVASLKKSRDK